jgi:hypothetical protein
MGKLIYSHDSSIVIDDRLLAHLKLAVIAKLRRDEKFSLSWVHDDGSGRSTIWVHPSIPLRFEFDGSRAPVINRAWVEALVMSANSTGGLQMVPEPPATPQPAQS